MPACSTLLGNAVSVAAVPRSQACPGPAGTTGRAARVEGGDGHAVGLDVVGVAVAAVLVVGDDDLRAHLARRPRRARRGLLEIGLPEARRAVVLRPPIIPLSRQRPAPPRNRWSVTPRAAQAAASSPMRCAPSASSRSLARCASSAGEDLALLAQGAGHQGDLRRPRRRTWPSWRRCRWSRRRGGRARGAAGGRAAQAGSRRGGVQGDQVSLTQQVSLTHPGGDVRAGARRRAQRRGPGRPVRRLKPATSRYTSGAREVRLANAATLDMETGLRAYLLTGQERFLVPYREGAASLPVHDRLGEGGVPRLPGHARPAGRDGRGPSALDRRLGDAGAGRAARRSRPAGSTRRRPTSSSRARRCSTAPAHERAAERRGATAAGGRAPRRAPCC